MVADMNIHNLQRKEEKMAHADTPNKGVHAESGVAGIAGQAVDKYARQFADFLFRQGWFIQLLSTVGALSPTALAWLIRGVFGAFNFPVGGKIGAWANIMMDKVASEVAETIERHPDILRQGAHTEKTRDELIDEGKAALRGKVFYMLVGMAHASKTCVLLQGMIQKLTRPARTGKDGKVQPAILTEKLVETTLPDIMAACVPLCPACVGTADITAGSEPRESEALPVKSFFDLLKEYAETDEASFEVFWTGYRSSEDEVRNKFLHAFGRDGDLADLQRIAVRPPDEWEALLDAKLGNEQHGFIKSLKKAASGFVRKVTDKLSTESDETSGMFDAVGNALKEHAEELNRGADMAKGRNRLRKEQGLRRRLAKATDPDYRARLEARIAALYPETETTEADIIGEEDVNV